MRERSRPRTQYKTTSWREYNAGLKARGSLTVCLDKDMQWLAAPTGKRGRQPAFTDATIQFCLSIRCLFGLPLRQSLGLVESLLGLAGTQWPVPDYSSLSRRQEKLKVQLPYRPSQMVLDLLVNSTGVKFLGKGEWKRKKHGAESHAIIPPLKNAQIWKTRHAGGEMRQEAVRACQRRGRRLWKKWSGYHRRSLVETKMHCF